VLSRDIVLLTYVFFQVEQCQADFGLLVFDWFSACAAAPRPNALINSRRFIPLVTLLLAECCRLIEFPTGFILDFIKRLPHSFFSILELTGQLTTYRATTDE